MAKTPTAVVKRLKSEVPKFQKVLDAARSRDINEADTVVIVTDMLEQVFGMDKYTDITREFAIKGTYVDLAVTLESKLVYLVEVKAIGLDLKSNHLRQVVDYAAKEGVKWAVLTNGIEWEIHRVSVSGQVSSEEVVSFNFLELSNRKESDLDLLYLLCKKGVTQDLIEGYYEHQQACNRFVIGALMGSEESISLMKRMLKKITPGLRATDDELKDLIENQVIKREVQFSESGLEAQKKVKKLLAKNSKPKPKKDLKGLDSTVEDDRGMESDSPSIHV